MIILLLLLQTAFAEQKIEINDLLLQAEIDYGFPRGLLSAMAFVESSSNHKAYTPKDGCSQKESFGLLQIQLAAARQMGFRGKAIQLMKPEVNITYAGKYLQWLMKTHEYDVSWSLTCYNAGPNSKLCKNHRITPYVGLVLNALLTQEQ